MPGILSRFKRSPSTSSSISESDPSPGRPKSGSLSIRSNGRDRRQSTVSSAYLSDQDEEGLTSGRPASPAHAHGPRESLFVEDFGVHGNTLSPNKRQLTPSPRRSPGALSLPPSASRTQPLGTPKLVLTEEGSNSPRSFSSSPLGHGRGNVGLGFVETEPEIDTPTQSETSFSVNRIMSLPVDDPSRDRAGSIASSNGTRSRRGSILSRNRADTISPPHSPHALKPVDSRVSSTSKRSRRKGRKSVSSGTSGIAAALAKGGLHIAGPVSDDLMRAVHSKKRSGQKRSPFLTRGREAGDDDDGHSGHVHDYGDDDFDPDDFDDDDDSDSDGGGDLPVTGFAVASNRRNADFHALFPTIDEGDYLIEDILVQGRLYVSENHICFHANIFGWVTDVVVAFSDVKVIEKKMTALVIPNAIGVYTFASLINRDSTYDVMMNIWRLCNPNAVMSNASLLQAAGQSRPGSVVGDYMERPGAPSAGSGGKKGHAPTQCACGRDGKHYSETALETIFPSTPEKVYNLMFNSGWFKTFLSDSQKLRDIESSEWRPVSDTNPLLTRSISYIKPLNGSIGPKQTKCHIVDEHEHVDLDDYITMVTTTRTPDVPSGGVFSVKTRTCFMWAGSNSTKVVVTTTVEWTGKSWVKGIIEKSAIEGQKQYHDDLEAGMRKYIKENPVEFAGEGGADEEEAVDPAAVVDVKVKEPTSEAQAYADRTRRQRKDEELSLLQAGVDSLISGVKAILIGIRGVGSSVSDMLADTPFRTQNLLGAIILILVISNIWTYMSIDRAATQQRRARRIGVRVPTGAGPYEDEELAEAVRRVLAQREHDPRQEALELAKILDDVESRVTRLRASLSAVRAGESTPLALD
ncbi:hypothetical protein IAU60_000531 [Kwoniella sp. DSM 27419]